MPKELYSLSDVAKMLMVQPYQIHYLLSIDSSLEPRLRVAGKRLWTHEEIGPLSKRLKQHIPSRSNRTQGGDHD